MIHSTLSITAQDHMYCWTLILGKKKVQFLQKKKKKKLQIDNLQQTKDISAARFGTSDD